MKSSLRAFMKGIIDYAGLFPPADLSLDTSINNYAAYRKSPDSWMLARFIIPAARLSVLDSYKDLLSDGAPFEFSVLGKGTETVDEYVQQLQEITVFLNQFHQQHGKQVVTDIMELKLPREAILSHDPDLLRRVYEETSSALNKANFPKHVFVEGFFVESWKKDVSMVMETLNEFNSGLSNSQLQYLGYKLRCGGVEAHMFPSIEQVAYVINAARDQNIAMKCTAGLHHPIRHYADSVQTKMHGFFNVFGGAMLSYANDLSEDELCTILREEDPEQFQFTDEGLKFKQWQVSEKEISELREIALISYGSCSFDEPREDLRQLNLL